MWEPERGRCRRGCEGKGVWIGVPPERAKRQRVLFSWCNRNQHHQVSDSEIKKPHRVLRAKTLCGRVYSRSSVTGDDRYSLRTLERSAYCLRLTWLDPWLARRQQRLHFILSSHRTTVDHVVLPVQARLMYSIRSPTEFPIKQAHDPKYLYHRLRSYTRKGQGILVALQEFHVFRSRRVRLLNTQRYSF